MEQHNKNIFVLSDTCVQGAQNLPVIETIPIEPSVDISSFDALIFTSKNSVKHLDNFTGQWRTIPAYAISSQTAKEIEQKKGLVVFVGKKGHGDQFAKELIPLLKGKKTAFIGAKKIVSDLVNILQTQGIVCDHIAVYETRCKKDKQNSELPADAIIIFSSPSTIKCFFENFEWKESYRAISIGDTTAKYFPNNIHPFISDERTLESCVQKGLNLR